jgi:5-methylcytosine-specific restriction endonuclease McrA
MPQITGENHYLWRKDRDQTDLNKKRLYLKENIEWRDSVFKRDNYKCKICNKTGRLEAHHILQWRYYPELRFDVNNGITLCHACHPRKEAEEKRLIPIFQELVSVS